MFVRRKPLVTFIRMKNKVATRVLPPGTIAPVLALEKSAAVVKIMLFRKP
jgi:hypothetical protein